jgi:outer membrane protein assembly factor BamB
VYQAQVFFGNDAGTLAAVQTDTSALVWSSAISSGAAIRSTPAIDPATGDLSFSADDGVVYVDNAATGAAVGSTTIGGLLTSPTVNNGTIYVGSDNSTLNSLNEETGAINWSRTLAGAVHATPALDTATGILVSGDDSGAIRAFTGTSGAPLWQVTTGGPVTAAPTIVGGIVYVGSADGNVYALNETSGAAVWKYAAGTPITTGAVYDPNFSLVYAGGTNGTLYALNAGAGTLAWSTVPQRSPLSPYVGISAAKWLVFANISSGSLISYRSSQFGRFNSNHKTAAALTTAPAVNDGTVYLGASDGGVYAYTTTGALPQSVSKSVRNAAARLAATRQHAAAHVVQRLYPRFSWTGQRDIALHIDAISRTASAAPSAIVYHGGAVQTAARSYAIFWKPAGSALEKRFIPAAMAALRGRSGGSAGAAFAGAYLDTTPYPAQLSDAAVQTEIARAIAANHWNTGVNSQFLVLTANGAVPPNAGFCSYHSAFALGHDPSKLVVYALVPYSGAVSACATPAALTHTGDPAIDAATANLARVQRELINDPLLNGWHDASGGEVEPGF